MQKYVAGLAFNESRKQVAMVLKNRPGWQAGQFNGIGGKVEEGEDFLDAMVREFDEETGVRIAPEQWTHIGSIHGPDFEVRFYRAVTNAVLQCRTTTDEEIQLLPVSMLQDYPLVPNASVMLAAATQYDNTITTVTFKE